MLNLKALIINLHLRTDSIAMLGLAQTKEDFNLGRVIYRIGLGLRVKYTDKWLKIKKIKREL